MQAGRGEYREEEKRQRTLMALNDCKTKVMVESFVSKDLTE